MRVLALIFVITFRSAPVGADGPVPAVNVDASGVALHGYDAVAYFSQHAAVKGDARFALTWSGATWLFATASNRDRFADNPASYAPQFGGYCSWAVSRNYTADIEPEAFDVVNGKLYLNYSKAVQLRWKLDRAGNIGKAEQNWPRLVAPAKGTK
jgi:hypothetical protein